MSDYESKKFQELGRHKEPGGWKVIFIEYYDGHSRHQGKDHLAREGLKFSNQKKHQKPWIGR